MEFNISSTSQNEKVVSSEKHPKATALYNELVSSTLSAAQVSICEIRESTSASAEIDIVAKCRVFKQ
jgi:hypothetical protein